MHTKNVGNGRWLLRSEVAGSHLRPPAGSWRLVTAPCLLLKRLHSLQICQPSQTSPVVHDFTHSAQAATILGGPCRWRKLRKQPQALTRPNMLMGWQRQQWPAVQRKPAAMGGSQF